MHVESTLGRNLQLRCSAELLGAVQNAKDQMTGSFEVHFHTIHSVSDLSPITSFDLHGMLVVEQCRWFGRVRLRDLFESMCVVLAAVVLLDRPLTPPPHCSSFLLQLGTFAVPSMHCLGTVRLSTVRLSR